MQATNAASAWCPAARQVDHDAAGQSARKLAKRRVGRAGEVGE